MTEASQSYENASAGLGNYFLDDVKRAIDSLREHPYLGHGVGRNLRSMLLHRFPFSLIYSVEPDEILVVAVAHHGMRHGYWRDRMDR